MRNLLKLFLWMTLLFLISGCGNRPDSTEIKPDSTIKPSWVGTLKPYQSPSPSVTSKPPTSFPDVPTTPVPTATPFTHTIVKGETMLGIAIRYGITLEDLRSANPDVDPRIMSIGQVLVIPLKIEEGLVDLFAIPTPVEIPINPPRCFESESGLECIVEIQNDKAIALEGLRVGFGLFNEQGEILGSEVGIPALNRLLPGESIPVVVRFNDFPIGQMPDRYLTNAELLGSLPIESSEDDRYLELQVDDIQVEIGSDGKSALVSGIVASNYSTNYVWLLAVAYDAQEQAVGVRKWKTQIECIQETNDPLAEQNITPTPTGEQTCPTINFQFEVYSLGPEIVTVRVIHEAVPTR